VNNFRLDKYLVTVGRFRQFVNYVASASGAPPAGGSGKHTYLNGGQGLVNSGSSGGVAFETGWDATDWNVNIVTGSGAASTWTSNLTGTACYDSPAFATWTASVGSNENLPINCVNWYEAYAFCIWDGGFFPSEAEWEYVAAGGSQQREYPWGSTAPGVINLYAIYGCYNPLGADGTCTGVTNIPAVGSIPAGAGFWGQLDLAGELYEWNVDWLATYVDPCNDCSYLLQTTYRVIRGGYWGGSLAELPPSNRILYSLPATRDTAVGIRCARAP
jgi:formylglycine-generating enzyme required for sulfatase activity